MRYLHPSVGIPFHLSPPSSVIHLCCNVRQPSHLSSEVGERYQKLTTSVRRRARSNVPRLCRSDFAAAFLRVAGLGSMGAGSRVENCAKVERDWSIRKQHTKVPRARGRLLRSCARQGTPPCAATVRALPYAHRRARRSSRARCGLFPSERPASALSLSAVNRSPVEEARVFRPERTPHAASLARRPLATPSLTSM